MKNKSPILSALGAFFVALLLASNAYAGETKESAKTVEREYLIRGMTCAGCAFGVKKALERAGIERTQILGVDHKKPDPENNIGHARVRFPAGEYKGKETDCKVAREIKSNPGYQVFWDKDDQNPCAL